MSSRRFPPPWTVEDHNRACFIVKDKNGHSLAFVYYEEEAGRQAAANLMTKDEARRIAAASPSCRSCGAGRSIKPRCSCPARTLRYWPPLPQQDGLLLTPLAKSFSSRSRILLSGAFFSPNSKAGRPLLPRLQHFSVAPDPGQGCVIR